MLSNSQGANKGDKFCMLSLKCLISVEFVLWTKGVSVERLPYAR